MVDLDSDHAAGLVTRDERHREHSRARQRVGAATCGLLVLERPSHDFELLSRERHQPGHGHERGGLGDEHGRRDGKRGLEVFDGHRGHVAGRARSRDVAREREQRRGVPLADRRVALFRA